MGCFDKYWSTIPLNLKYLYLINYLFFKNRNNPNNILMRNMILKKYAFVIRKIKKKTFKNMMTLKKKMAKIYYIL